MALRPDLAIGLPFRVLRASGGIGADLFPAITISRLQTGSCQIARTDSSATGREGLFHLGAFEEGD